MTASPRIPRQLVEPETRSAADIKLRPLAAEDLPAVYRIEAAASADPWSESLFRDELSPDGPPRHWIVAVDRHDDETIVGFGGVLFAVDEAHIMNIAVAPGRQRQGVAARMLAALLITASDRGAAGATLEVRPSNSAAIALYHRFRFVESGRRPRYYADGEAASIMWAHAIYRPDYRQLLDRELVGFRSDPSVPPTEGVQADD